MSAFRLCLSTPNVNRTLILIRRASGEEGHAAFNGQTWLPPHPALDAVGKPNHEVQAFLSRHSLESAWFGDKMPPFYLPLMRLRLSWRGRRERIIFLYDVCKVELYRVKLPYIYCSVENHSLKKIIKDVYPSYSKTLNSYLSSNVRNHDFHLSHAMFCKSLATERHASRVSKKMSTSRNDSEELSGS